MTGKEAEDRPERRRYPRFQGARLMANIGGRLVRVAGISAGGMTLEKGFSSAAGLMRFTLYPTTGNKVDINSGIGGTGEIVHEEGDLISLRFNPASYRLVKFVAECSGAGPDHDSYLSSTG